jgi:DNA-directed RNA polymerase subunit RPC12/RpoP
MNARVSFSCPVCNARLRASVRYVGQSCACPKCGKQIIVRFPVYDEVAPALVWDDGFTETQEATR